VPRATRCDQARPVRVPHATESRAHAHATGTLFAAFHSRGGGMGVATARRAGGRGNRGTR
jgi:hypothetical protein